MNEYRTCWQAVNKALVETTEKLCCCLEQIINDNPPARIAHSFLIKATRTLRAVNLLCEHNLWEQTQALVRILIEIRVTFDYFLQMLAKDPQYTFTRVWDSVMLEKMKQQRASNFKGLDLLPNAPSKGKLEEVEREITTRYSKEQLRCIRKHGFTGISIEQRAIRTGHKDLYQIVYRNFSRNIHSTDFVEYYFHQKNLRQKDGFDDDYVNDYYKYRDSITLYTANFSTFGIAEWVNIVYKLGFDTELKEIGKKQAELRSRKL